MDCYLLQGPNGQLTYCCFTYARRSQALLLAVITGLAMLWFLFPSSFWAGQGGFFEKIDASQHIAGWQFYVKDEWRYPLLKTTRVHSPEGVNIAFMDSIPLAALLLKPFARWLPEHFHYIAIWHVFVFVGQAIAASVLVSSLGACSLFATFVACLFACLWPALMWRFGHTALMTQSLLLFALAVYFQKKRAIIPASRAQVWLLLLSVIGLLIHPYFFAMLLSFFIFSLLEEIIMHGDWRTSALFFSIALMIFAVLLTVLGYSGQQTTSFGFGEYSMNLSSPFCGSHFYSCVDSEDRHQFASYHFADPTKGQYEGLNYLGLGVFLLLPVSVYTARSKLAEIFLEYKWFLLFLLALTVYSCANRIYWNEHLLFEYSVPQGLKRITDTFRSSGRFFWIVGYTLLFVGLAGAMQSLNKRKIALIVLALTLQFVDTRDFSQRLTRIAGEPAKGDLAAWAPVIGTFRFQIA